MNCPQCRSGVLEPIGYLKLEPGPVMFYPSYDNAGESPAIGIQICSNERCSNVHIRAIKDTLSVLKKYRAKMIS